jgi:signal transduction histidine kinase
LIDKIKRYAAPVCTARHIQLNMSTDGIPRDTLMPGEVRQNIFLVAKEAINNAVKYSDAKNCSISSSISGGKFAVEILDDGNGFDNRVNGIGNGLQNMKTRVQEIGGEILIISEPDKGTRIKIQLHYPFRMPVPASLSFKKRR